MMSTELASLLHAGSLCRVIATPRTPDAKRAKVADLPLFVRTESPLRPLGPGPRNSRSSDTKCGPYTFRTGQANLPVIQVCQISTVLARASTPGSFQTGKFSSHESMAEVEPKADSRSGAPAEDVYPVKILRDERAEFAQYPWAAFHPLTADHPATGSRLSDRSRTMDLPESAAVASCFR